MIYVFSNIKQAAFIAGVTIVTALIVERIVTRYWRNRTSHRYQPIIICHDTADWIKKQKYFIKQFRTAKFIGFDCEWVTVKEKRRPVALLQLATADGLIVLLRLCNIQPGFIPATLVELLADKKIVKVGVAICEDASKLLYDYGLIVESCLDLRHLIQDRVEFKNKKGLGLQTLSKVLLNADLKKTMALTCSDWEAETLSPKQIAYAAEDALAAAQIFKKLLEPSNRKWFFSNLDLATFQNFFNVPYKRVLSDVVNNLSKRLDKSYKCSNFYSKSLKNTARYENCKLEAPDGELLCACDTKKALWYVQKGRGEVMSENPLTVRLNFEPSSRPILDNKYYIQEKKNCCVVCGQTDFLIRKFIVPSEYRKYFPELMKKCLSHDVLLLCAPCHRKCNIQSDELRHQLAIECDAPIGTEKGIELKINSRMLQVKSAANALLSSRNKIPENRKLELRKIVCDYYETENITYDLIEQATQLNCFLVDDEIIFHGFKVFEYVCKHGGLMAFESRWRKYFLDTMEPKFLPEMWSINHNHERLALQVLQNKADFDISILGISDEMMTKVKNMNIIIRKC